MSGSEWYVFSFAALSRMMPQRETKRAVSLERIARVDRFNGLQRHAGGWLHRTGSQEGRGGHCPSVFLVKFVAGNHFRLVVGEGT